MSNQAPESHLQGLRTVATVEFTKGVVSILVAVSLIGLIHRDIGDSIASLLDWLHIAPEKHMAILLLRLADKVTPDKVKMVIAVALGYSLIRFVEAYGLWHARAWAEWFALLSGAAYFPLEILEIMRRPNVITWAILLINVAIVFYMGYIRVQAHNEKRAMALQLR